MCRKDMVKISCIENATKLVVSRTTVECYKIHWNTEGLNSHTLHMSFNSWLWIKDTEIETGSSGRYILSVLCARKIS